MTRRLTVAFALLIGLALPAIVGAQETSKKLSTGLAPLLNIVSGKDGRFALHADVEVKFDDLTIPVEMNLVRFDDQAFDLELTHPQYSVNIRRRRDATAFALPHHKVVFIGKGEPDENDQLSPKGIVSRLISPASMVGVYAPLAKNADPAAASVLLSQFLKIKYDSQNERWTAGNNAWFKFGETKLLELKAVGTSVSINRTPIGPLRNVDDWKGYAATSIDRTELERQLVRGVHRATEVLAPAPLLTSPQQAGRQVDHGELRWIEGHRVALLEGTPDQIGTAHGQLLKDESMRCIDSVLNAFGTVQTIVNGRWFRHDLEQAYARLSPHIPEDHKQETRALARSLGLNADLVEAVNVFPEMFHCSGFAVFGSATQDGKLYHGRVLDYMTTIGLQDAATTFIVAPKGKIAFANVGYGGFIGSVSGMNTKAISLGEMGGRGEGKWDGVPMATLMRRALEECSTLDEVINLWKSNPRTCEYYYVFADGKTNQAVGVAAYPESVEFVMPGESHPRLGEGIKDAVVLSAGSRLEELRRRVTKLHGSIDAGSAQTLMCRPVAMDSNLHNVLFVPADGVLYVANATHSQPAAERPYVRLDLNELLKAMPPAAPADKPAAGGK